MEAGVGQSLYSCKLGWYLAYSCNNCGNIIELDSAPPIPQDIRKAILEQSGYYQLTITDNRENRIKAAQCFYGLFNLSTSQALNLVKKVIAYNGVPGTDVEMEYIAKELKSYAVKYSINKIEKSKFYINFTEIPSIK
ncbi:hypothetical protein [Hyella patelloides]|uniref:hypothetical protein n=1 Tax=Hyella patelloides TaxID=1982969 RepID=UPI0011A434DA|nr:hypothetical protein [Hyella patelloides]